jgi:hypothetical protein
VQAVLGESWHPGGLALTRALAKEISLSRDDHVLDIACGRGASALMLAQVFKCRVTGVDTSATAIDQARREARRYRLENLVSFVQADATSLAFPAATFSAVFCECATSLFTDRRSAFGELARMLRPGGRLALSDVTFRPQALPEPIDSPLAQALCIPLGMGPEAYAQLLEESGFVLQRQTDYSGTIAQLLDKVESLLGLAQQPALAGQADGEPLRRIVAALHCARQLLQQGDLGYCAFIAQR